MTDQTIPADKVRTILDEWERIKEHADWDDIDNLIQDVRALLPTPPRPTLADMTDDERAACLRMQCDTAPNRSVRGFIADVYPGGCRVIERDTWEWRSCSDDLVTPRPDLPRMEWPGDQKPAPALPGGWRLADHKDNGRVIVTNPTPNSGGHVYFTVPTDGPMGYGCHFCDPAELTYIDVPATEESGTTTGPDHLAVGTVIESADDPRIDALPLGSILLDRNEEVTTKRPVAWTGPGYHPIPSKGDEFGPWTVLHIPKEAGQ